MRPRATFVALIVAALAGLGASRLTFDGDLAQLLPDAGPEWRETAQLLERVAVVDIEGTAEDARTFADRLDYAVRTAPTEGELLGVLDLFRDRAACFIQDYARVEARLKQIPRRIRELAQRLQEPGGFGQRAAHDPLGIGNEALLDFESFAAGFESARLDAGGVVNEKGTHRLLLVHPGFSPAETDRTAEFLADLGRAGEGLRIRHLGAHRSTRDNATTI